MSAHILLNLLNELRKRDKKQKNLRKILIIFLPINLNMCFGSTKEPSQ